jgi:hypothetical protein
MRCSATKSPRGSTRLKLGCARFILTMKSQTNMRHGFAGEAIRGTTYVAGQSDEGVIAGRPLTAQLRRPRAGSAMSAQRQHQPAAWRNERPLANGLANGSSRREAVIGGAEMKNIASDADMPTGGGSVASQSECSICCSAIAIVQGCCPFSQTELWGFSKLGSANIPTATAISSGRCSGSQKTVPPHSGQKLNVTVLPLSARRTYRLAMPLASRTCARG